MQVYESVMNQRKIMTMMIGKEHTKEDQNEQTSEKKTKTQGSGLWCLMMVFPDGDVAARAVGRGSPA